MSQFLQSLADNAAFLLACLAVFAGLILIAWAAERFFLPSHRKLSPARTVSFVAIFAALGGALMFFEIPLFFAPSFYEMDLSELPVLICTFYLGPVAGVVCEFLKVVIKLLLKGTSTAFVGDFANFAVGCAMVLPASILYHLHKSKKNGARGSGRWHAGDDRVRKRLQCLLPHPQVCRTLPHAARCHRCHGAPR